MTAQQLLEAEPLAAGTESADEEEEAEADIAEDAQLGSTMEPLWDSKERHGTSQTKVFSHGTIFKSLQGFNIATVIGVTFLIDLAIEHYLFSLPNTSTPQYVCFGQLLNVAIVSKTFDFVIDSLGSCSNCLLQSFQLPK